MKRIVLKTEFLAADQIIRMLEENHILMNDYARMYIAHPRFFSRVRSPPVMTVFPLPLLIADIISLLTFHLR